MRVGSEQGTHLTRFKVLYWRGSIYAIMADDVVACITPRRWAVPTGHGHSEGPLRMYGRGIEREQVTRIAEAVII
jgi:hypothetical protein